MKGRLELRVHVCVSVCFQGRFLQRGTKSQGKVELKDRWEAGGGDEIKSEQRE